MADRLRGRPTQPGARHLGISPRLRQEVSQNLDDCDWLDAMLALRGSPIQESAHLKASAAFLDEATARHTELSKAPPKTTKYGIFLWTEKYDQYLAVLELEPLCGPENEPTRPSWRDTGCIAFRRGFSRARAYTTATIPQLIRFTLPQLRSKGVAEALLAEIQTALAENRVRDAAAHYDSAALLTETL